MTVSTEKDQIAVYNGLKAAHRRVIRVSSSCGIVSAVAEKKVIHPANWLDFSLDFDFRKADMITVIAKQELKMFRSEQGSNPDLCDTYKVDTVLYQLSYQANWWRVIMRGHDNLLNMFDALFKSWDDI